MLKKILIAGVAILVVLALIGMLLPRHVVVQRAVAINRPPSMIYATINSFVLFPKWSPWQHLDPNMMQTVEGPREGVGAKLVWKGNDKVGSGTQVITASTPNQSMASDLNFGDRGTAKSVVTLTPNGGTTQVIWSVDMDMGAGPIGRYFGLMMDGMLGKDFAAGLDKLKTLVESMPNADIAGFEAELVQLPAVPLLVATETAPLDGLAKAYTDGYGQIEKFMAKNKLHQTGMPVSIGGERTATQDTFDAGIPVDRADVVSSDTVRLVQSYSGSALKTVYVGAYDQLTSADDRLSAYSAVHGYIRKGSTIIRFVDDPGTTPVEKLRSELYVPVE